MSNKEKLEKLIQRIDLLVERFVNAGDPEFCAWYEQCARFLQKAYGPKSHELETFESFRFSLACYSFSTPCSEYNRACVDDLKRVKAIFQSYLEEMQEEEKHNDNASPTNVCLNRNKIFIVHGHDGELKHSVARIVEKQGLTAVILSEQPNCGATVIEKIEKNCDVGAAICLFTADDNCVNDEEATHTMRARQNVVFEAGYFIGKLGRANVILLADKGIEMPSDLGGVVYTDTAKWEFALCSELKKMGFAIDMNRLVE